MDEEVECIWKAALDTIVFFHTDIKKVLVRNRNTRDEGQVTTKNVLIGLAI